MTDLSGAPTITNATVSAVLTGVFARAPAHLAAKLDGVRMLIERLTAAADLPFVALIAAATESQPDRADATDAIGRAARLLAPDGRFPSGDLERETLRALIWSLDRMHGSGAHHLGRPSFVTDDLLAALVNEATAAQPPHASDRRRVVAPAGDVLANLAVSRELRHLVSETLGFVALPTYDAVYEYDAPGSFVGPHVDARAYPYVLHVLLDHRRRTLPAASVLVTFSKAQRDPVRSVLSVGESLVLNGRGTLHCWVPLGDDERRMLVAIGFTRA